MEELSLQRALLSLVASAVLALPLSGCYTMRHYVESPVGEVSMGPTSGETKYRFKEEGRYFYVLGGLIPVHSPRTSDLLSKHQRRDVKISNLRIEQQYAPVDIGINLLSSYLLLGLLQSMTITYEGEVVEVDSKGGYPR